jgi:hypothetical protein
MLIWQAGYKLHMRSSKEPAEMAQKLIIISLIIEIK